MAIVDCVSVCVQIRVFGVCLVVVWFMWMVSFV